MSRTADIRPAVPSDARAIRACARAAYQQYVEAIGRDPAPMVADFDALIASGHVHVAIYDDTLAGFVVAYPTGTTMHLENVAVMTGGTGIGGRLIAFVEDQARAGGLRAVHLYTNARMTANLSLYPHLGYTLTDRRTEDGFDRIYFEKALT